LPPNLRFENFPIVDAVLAGLAGVTDHHPALEFVEIDAQLHAMLAAGAVRWRRRRRTLGVMILVRWEH